MTKCLVVLSAIGISFVLSAPAQATTTVLDFEGLQDGEAIGSYYAGGMGGRGSGPGPSDGASFVSAFPLTPMALQSTTAAGDPRNFSGQPSGTAIGLFLFLFGDITMNVPGGFSTGFSFFYCTPIAGEVRVFGADGGLLGDIPLVPQPPTSSGVRYDTWTPVGVGFSGVATSVVFSGIPSFLTITPGDPPQIIDGIGFDNITLGSATPAGAAAAVPEPLTMLSALLAASAVGFYARRRAKADLPA